MLLGGNAVLLKVQDCYMGVGTPQPFYYWLSSSVTWRNAGTVVFTVQLASSGIVERDASWLLPT